MADQTVIYKAYGLAECGCNSDVILCVDSALTATGAPFLEATLVSVSTLYDDCNIPVYNYYLTYDDADLAEGAALLTPADITGLFCAGCMKSYIDWMALIKPGIMDNVKFSLDASGASLNAEQVLAIKSVTQETDGSYTVVLYFKNMVLY